MGLERSSFLTVKPPSEWYKWTKYLTTGLILVGFTGPMTRPAGGSHFLGLARRTSPEPHGAQYLTSYYILNGFFYYVLLSYCDIICMPWPLFSENLIRCLVVDLTPSSLSRSQTQHKPTSLWNVPWRFLWHRNHRQRRPVTKPPQPHNDTGPNRWFPRVQSWLPAKFVRYMVLLTQRHVCDVVFSDRSISFYSIIKISSRCFCLNGQLDV